MASKAFLVLGVLLAVILVISTEVAAREVAEHSNAGETKTTTKGVDEYGHDEHGWHGHDDHGWHGHDGHGHDGHGGHGHDGHATKDVDEYGHHDGHGGHGHDGHGGHGHDKETQVEPKN